MHCASIEDVEEEDPYPCRGYRGPKGRISYQIELHQADQENGAQADEIG